MIIQTLLFVQCFSGNATEDWSKLQSLEAYPSPPVSVSVSPAEALSSRIEFFEAKEARFREYRELGIIFWNRYPHDSRRYQWLAKTNQQRPKYFLDLKAGAVATAKRQIDLVRIDYEARDAWKARYAEMRESYVKAREVSDSDRRMLTYHEFFQDIFEAQEDTLRGKRYDVFNFRDRMLAAGMADLTMFDVVVRYAKDFGLDEQGLRQYLAPLKSKPGSLSEYVKAKEQYLAYLHKPLELDVVDLKAFRGKVVLIDLWATTCTSCVEAMPEVKRVHDKYRDRGLEVVSICADGKDRAEYLKRIETKVGFSTNPVCLETEQGVALLKRFGFFGVPQYILLDREGRIVASTGELGPERLERTVARFID